MSDNAKRDGNYVPTMMAVSSADGVTPVVLYADPITHRLYVDQPAVATGVVAPSSTPSAIGQMYVDTVALKVYVSTGVASSSDWTILN